MSSAINPLGSSSQTPAAGNQVSKTMHSQAATTYGEPSIIPQGGVGIAHTNTNVAHSHPNQHHYSLNSPNAAGHYINQNLGQIPASNHPVANSTVTVSAQGFTPQKNVSNFISNYEDGLSHQQNQTAYPPVSQSLPPSVPSSQPKTTSESLEQQQSDKPQSNGTSEVKSPQKNETNPPALSPISKEKSVQPAPVPQLSEVQEKAEEKPTSASATIPTPLPQLKPSEATNAKAQLTTPSPPTPPPVVNSKPVPPISPDTQSSETSPPATTAVNSASSAHMRNNNKSASSAITTTTIGTSEKEQPGPKKAKVDENSTPSEKVENLKKMKPVESDKETNEERASSIEKTPPKEEPLLKPPTTPATAASPVETSAKSPTRKVKHQPSKLDDVPKLIKDPKVSLAQKSPSTSKAKRQRVRTQPYQSPLPEVELISKISSLPPRTPRTNDDKLIVFYKKEFLAVRNAEGGFYLCQTMQNIYKSSSKIKIRWLSQDNSDKSGEIYTPDFYDLTDFDCILTNLSLNRIDKGKFRLPPSEKDRTESILNRSLAVEKGEATPPSLTEEHPDGLDLSLYRDEDQLKKRATRKRKAGRKPLSLSTAKKRDAVRKSPEAAKVRKVAPPTKSPERNAAAAGRKTQQPIKKTTTQPEIKKSTSTKRAPVRGRRKTDDKSPVVDHKKAKVLARIGIKTSIPAARSIPSNVKSAKSRPKVASASSRISIPVKTNVAAKPPPRNARRSARK